MVPGQRASIRHVAAIVLRATCAAGMALTIAREAPAAAYTAIDRQIVYDPPKIVRGVDDPRCTQTGFERHVACRLAMMKRDGATPKAIRFARALTRWRGYFGYATAVSPGRFGPVALVQTLGSGISTYGSAVLVTPQFRFINPDDVRRIDQIQALRNTQFRSLATTHPQATIWPQAGAVVETPRRDGGQRYVVTHPIVDGCHACPLLGAARLALDFAPNGGSRGTTLIDVRAGRRAWFGR